MSEDGTVGYRLYNKLKFCVEMYRFLNAQTPTGNEILREYDLCDRVTAELHKEKNGTISNRTTYSYDEMGNLTEVTNVFHEE